MKSSHNTLYRVRILAFGLLFALGSLIWIQSEVSPAAAQEPVTDLTIRVEAVGEGFSTAEVGTTPTFEVGDLFNISIVAENVTDPGIFGSQFQVVFDTVYLEAIEGSFVSGAGMDTVARQTISNTLGTADWAASRQGDVDNVTGNVTLATLTLEAIAPTEPTTIIDLGDVKLGAKGGINVPISGFQGIEIIIRDPSRDDIAGFVTVEGRAADNQDGHTVTAQGLNTYVSPSTGADGSFLIEDVEADTYDVTATSAGFLAATCTGVVHTIDGLIDLLPVELLAGDINADSAIDITDAIAIGLVFGAAGTEQGEDLNVDGGVDILDLILMSANYGQTSADNLWICQ